MGLCKQKVLRLMRIQRLEAEHYPSPMKQAEEPGFQLLLPFFTALFRTFEKSGAVALETERSPIKICCRVRFVSVDGLIQAILHLAT